MGSPTWSFLSNSQFSIHSGPELHFVCFTLLSVFGTGVFCIVCFFYSHHCNKRQFFKIYTLPNMVCLPFNSCVAPRVKKNWLWLSLGPALAIATSPLRTKRSLWWNSSYESKEYLKTSHWKILNTSLNIFKVIILKLILFTKMDHINQNQVQKLPWKVFHKLILRLRQEQKKIKKKKRNATFSQVSEKTWNTTLNRKFILKNQPSTRPYLSTGHSI